ncbi:hypothetical protein DHEL01_v200251 [Diaporthe helianthi]|uniref:5'-3' DNA helicase ZGRF1-like N-terminal domain-containing protein n=1 Tax=Diaporthe helianthi TaxID=158607 RepID=A0A2P5IFU5_DIAHE|nr:hypothetical protein DHEL01_v200251 [Diaporthe helianthi]
MAGPAPSTATVLEFRCLFTHDLRRKQKRWQDGRLKYHSFNARVMVYDERGNSVGDMHWHGEYDFGEGEEVQLDRGGVIVQVEDLVERNETDLSELVDKRVQEKQQRQMQQLARSRASSTALPRSLPRSLPRPAAVAPDSHQPPPHRPLHHVIGTPTGHHGKALVPNESPCEQRQQAAGSPGDRTAKRRKYDEPPPSKSGYASALFGQTLTLSATPSSSVSKIRRPRPEARSDPPPETDAQSSRAVPEPARREQPQLPRRLNQSGYAQSLFGQALTLSHTPVSSMSSMTQQQNESVSKTMVDGDAQEYPGRLWNPAPQALNERRQFDKFSSRSGTDSLSTRSKASNRPAKDKGTGSADIGESNACASLSQKRNATKSVQTSPETIDVIDIDDPDPIAPPPVRYTKMQKTTQAISQRPQKSLGTSKVEVRENHGSPKDQARSRRLEISEAGHQGKFKMAGSNGRADKPDKAVARANGRNTSSGQADTAARGVGSRAPETTRDPTLPVTELRIKSSKKRGLLMISDTSKAKKTRRQVPADAARSFNGDSTHCSGDSNDEDPFQSPLLAISDQTIDGHKSAKRNADQQTGQEGLEQEKATSHNASHPHLCSVDHGGEVPADMFQPKKRSSSSPRAECDPYQDPSSPRASGPAVSLPAHRNGRDHDTDIEILGQIDYNTKVSKALRRRQSRRKVIADDGDDDDDDDDADPAAPLPSHAGVGSDSEPGAFSLLCDEAANNQPKSRKSTDTRAQKCSPSVESGKEGAGRTTHKTKGQPKELGMESEEDELPLVRRQSRRQARSRPIPNEEPSPLPSEQDDFEEEDNPRKRHKTKASKVSENRPRLEKIKKNIKSRELVGLNLVALNATLGLRGIGMPFSILPSPVSESVQTRVSTRAVADENKSSVVVDDCDNQILPSGPNLSAAPHPSSQAQQKSLSTTSEKDETNNAPLDSSNLDANRSNSPGEDDFGARVDLDALAYLNVPEIRDFGKAGGLGVDLQRPPRNQDRQTVGQAPSSKQSRIPHEPVPSKPSTVAQPYHVTMPQDIAGVEPAEQTLSSLEKPARKPSPTPPRQSTVANHIISDKAIPEAPPKTVASAQRQSAPAQTAATELAINTGPLLRDKINVDGQQPSTTVRATQNVMEAQTTEPVAADQRANMSTKSQAAMSLSQGKPSIREHLSMLESTQASNTVQSGPNVQADTFTVPSAVDKPDSALDRHSLATRDQDPGTIQKSVGNAESDRASALPDQPPNTIGLRRQASALRSINNIGAKSTPQAEKTGSPSTGVHNRQASNARLANPASRGRKAALASHAAGPVPQRLLPPTQPNMMFPVSTADLAMTQIEQAPKEPERPKKKMTFPGFQSARGDGPWSREAFDLLESGKPE